MKRAVWMSFSLTLALTLAACSSGGGDRSVATQEKFGVRMAKMNLWREAMFRFKRAVEINPADAMARNNLAVAYEANGDFEQAGREYREAIRLDKSNQFIQKNYSRFVEFNSRNRKRQPKPATAAAPQPADAAPAVPASAVPASVSPPSEPPASTPQPTGSAPAAIPPVNPPAAEPPPPTPQPEKPPGGVS